MSAASSHELNPSADGDPVFCENAVQFLERDRPDRTAENLTVSRRCRAVMARITSEPAGLFRRRVCPQTPWWSEPAGGPAHIELTQTYVRDAGRALNYGPANAPVLGGVAARCGWGRCFVNPHHSMPCDAMGGSDANG